VRGVGCVQLHAKLANPLYGSVLPAKKPIKVVDLLSLVPSDPVTIAPATQFQYTLSRRSDAGLVVCYFCAAVLHVEFESECVCVRVCVCACVRVCVCACVRVCVCAIVKGALRLVGAALPSPELTQVVPAMLPLRAFHAYIPSRVSHAVMGCDCGAFCVFVRVHS
jgi:hypothetical protein